MSAIWHGLAGFEWATVVILASGPSLTVEQCEVVRDWREGSDMAWRLNEPRRRVIAINNTFRRAPWADVLYGCDAPWWRVHHAEAAQVFAGQLWTQDRAAMELTRMHLVESVRNPGLGRMPGVIHQGGNGGYQAINLAWQAGAARIVLLGYDMHGTHWHGKHEHGLTNTPPWLFPQWIKNFDRLAADLEDFDIVNCTPGSALRAFRTSALEDALNAHRDQHHPARPALSPAGV